MVSITNVKGWPLTDHLRYNVSQRRQHRLDLRFEADVWSDDWEPNAAYKHKYIVSPRFVP